MKIANRIIAKGKHTARSSLNEAERQVINDAALRGFTRDSGLQTHGLMQANILYAANISGLFDSALQAETQVIQKTAQSYINDYSNQARLNVSEELAYLDNKDRINTINNQNYIKAKTAEADINADAIVRVAKINNSGILKSLNKQTDAAVKSTTQIYSIKKEIESANIDIDWDSKILKEKNSLEKDVIRIQRDTKRTSKNDETGLELDIKDEFNTDKWKILNKEVDKKIDISNDKKEAHINEITLKTNNTVKNKGLKVTAQNTIDLNETNAQTENANKKIDNTIDNNKLLNDWEKDKLDLKFNVKRDTDIRIKDNTIINTNKEKDAKIQSETDKKDAALIRQDNELSSEKGIIEDETSRLKQIALDANDNTILIDNTDSERDINSFNKKTDDRIAEENERATHESTENKRELDQQIINLTTANDASKDRLHDELEEKLARVANTNSKEKDYIVGMNEKTLLNIVDRNTAKTLDETKNQARADFVQTEKTKVTAARYDGEVVSRAENEVTKATNQANIEIQKALTAANGIWIDKNNEYKVANENIIQYTKRYIYK